MTATSLDIVILGLSITSSWGNGHATTFRGLVKELTFLGHNVLFLERDVPWYRDNRDLPAPPYGETTLYSSLDELRDGFTDRIRNADVVMLGSYVPEGAHAAKWLLENATGLTVFYDIDTPVTIAALRNGGTSYISAELIPRFDLYLSFTGGPFLDQICHTFGARNVRPLYCSVDLDTYYPEPEEKKWDLGYMGTYSKDRQSSLHGLMNGAADAWPEGRFVVAGPQYPATIRWPANVQRIEHLAPNRHRSFYNRQRFTLNLTRNNMIQAGYSPSVRLFEAAACAVPIISDYWEGIETFFKPGKEILISRSSGDTLGYIKMVPEEERIMIGKRALIRIFTEHTASHRAQQFATYVRDLA